MKYEKRKKDDAKPLENQKKLSAPKPSNNSLDRHERLKKKM